MILMLTLEHIINYCGKKSYQRGKEYLNTDALYMCYKDHMNIRAFCEGIISSSYQVWVSFDALGIENSNCTCKGNILGPCKHIAALLLAWHYRPQIFFDRNNFVKSLNSKKKKELILLIEKMVDSYNIESSQTPAIG